MQVIRKKRFVDEEGTMLFECIDNSSLPGVLSLLGKGVSATVMRPDGVTPLSRAKQLKRTEIVEVLEAHIARGGQPRLYTQERINKFKINKAKVLVRALAEE
jgi:hypothetical protein